MTEEESKTQIALGTHPHICKGCKRLNLWFHEVAYGYCEDCRFDGKDLVEK